MSQKYPILILFLCGLQASPSLAVDGKELDDPARHQWVSGILDRIVTQAGGKRGQISLTLLDSPEFNAFAGANNDVYVTKGLMDAVGSDDELASVVAHEVVHIVRSHVKKAMQKQAIQAGVVGILSQVSKNQNVATAGNILSNLENLRFAREEESEADELGFKYFVKAGFAPAGFIEMLTKLTQKGSSPGVMDFLSTHPNSASRLKLARERTAKLPPEIQQRRTRSTMPGAAGGYGEDTEDIPTVSAPGFRPSSRGEDDIPTYSAGGKRSAGGSVYDPYSAPASRPPAPAAPTSGPGWRTITLKNGKTIRVDN